MAQPPPYGMAPPPYDLKYGAPPQQGYNPGYPQQAGQYAYPAQPQAYQQQGYYPQQGAMYQPAQPPPTQVVYIDRQPMGVNTAASEAADCLCLTACCALLCCCCLGDNNC